MHQIKSILVYVFLYLFGFVQQADDNIIYTGGGSTYDNRSVSHSGRASLALPIVLVVPFFFLSRLTEESYH
jgi:hypothetical protein